MRYYYNLIKLSRVFLSSFLPCFVAPKWLVFRTALTAETRKRKNGAIGMVSKALLDTDFSNWPIKEKWKKHTVFKSYEKFGVVENSTKNFVECCAARFSCRSNVYNIFTFKKKTIKPKWVPTYLLGIVSDDCIKSPNNDIKYQRSNWHLSVHIISKIAVTNVCERQSSEPSTRKQVFVTSTIGTRSFAHGELSALSVNHVNFSQPHQSPRLIRYI